MRAAHLSPLWKVMDETTLKLPEAYSGLTTRERLDGWILLAMEARIYEFYIWEMQGGKMTSTSEHSVHLKPSGVGVMPFNVSGREYLPILDSLEFVGRRLEFLEIPHACCPLEVS